MTDAATEIGMKVRPCRLSWVDRFTNWVEKLPVRAWIFYVVFGIVLILVQMLFLWLDRGLQAEELLPVIIFNGLATPLLLALIHLLDNQAVATVNSMSPMLDTTEQEFDQYEYRLSNMPFLAPLIAGLAMTVSTILIERVSITPIRYAALEQLRVFAAVFYIIDKSSAFLFGVVLYHTIRQLRLVNAINSNHVRINLFDLRPLQAFSQCLREDDYSATEMLNGTICSLEIQHTKVKAIPTWPWRPETARFVLTAIPLPLVLKIIQFLVEQAFD